VGSIKKIMSIPNMKMFFVDVVYTNDTFEYWADEDGKHVKHAPCLTNDRGEFQGVYAVAKTKDGTVYAEYMNHDEVEKHRKCSKQANSGPWRDWYDQMAKKTIIHRIAKKMPTTDEILNIVDRDKDLYELERPPEAEALEPPTKPLALMEAIDVPAPPETEEHVDEDGVVTQKPKKKSAKPGKTRQKSAKPVEEKETPPVNDDYPGEPPAWIDADGNPEPGSYEPEGDIL